MKAEDNDKTGCEKCIVEQ